MAPQHGQEGEGKVPAKKEVVAFLIMGQLTLFTSGRVGFYLYFISTILIKKNLLVLYLFLRERA